MDIEIKNRILFDPQVCVKCGYCKSSCPTYLAKKDERFSPRGRLILSKNLIYQDFLNFFRYYYDIDTCSKCLECERKCPVGLKPWLNFVISKNQTFAGKFEAFLAKLMSKNRFFFSLAFSFLMKIRGCNIHSDGKLKLNGKVQKEVKRSKDVLIFPTCFGYTIFKETLLKAKRILEYFGVNASVVPDGFACCGAPIYLSGDIKGFTKHISGLYKRFAEGGQILVLGSTCTWILKYVLPYETGLSLHVEELSDFLSELIDDFPAPVGKKIFVHKPCHRESDKIELFFRRWGIDFVESDFPCCGFGGSLMFKHKDMSDSLLAQTLEGKKVDFAVSTSPGCILQISRKLKVYHFVDFVFEYFSFGS